MPSVAPIAQARGERRPLDRVSFVVMRELLLPKPFGGPRVNRGTEHFFRGKAQETRRGARCTTTQNFFRCGNPLYFLSI
jgi:hypothetical protein